MMLSVDPGINGTGYVVWSVDRKGVYKIVEFKILHAPGNLDWMEKCVDIASKLAELKIRYDIRQMCIEYPAYFGTASGEMVASRGDLLKLTFLVGLIYSEFVPFSELVPVQEWKGQLPKKVVEERIKKTMDKEEYKDAKSHVWDAIGIGLYKLGKFK